MSHMKKSERQQRAGKFEAQRQRRTQKRDKKGRFAKKLPLDEDLVQSLGADRRIAQSWLGPDAHWHLVEWVVYLNRADN
jgi:hypothetical protein